MRRKTLEHVCVVPFWPGRRAVNSVCDERSGRPILDRFTGPPDPELDRM